MFLTRLKDLVNLHWEDRTAPSRRYYSEKAYS